MKINKNYVIKHVLDSDILIDIKSNVSSVVKLNKTSKDICELINNGLNRNEIVQNLANKYDVDINELNKDVNEFIDLMILKGIVNE